MPGIGAELAFHPTSNLWFGILTGIGTLAAFVTFVLLARWSKLSLAVTTILVLSLSMINSCLCLALYQA